MLAAAVAEPFDEAVFWAGPRGAFRRVGGRDTPLAPSARSRLVDLNLDPPFPNGSSFRVAWLGSNPDFMASFKPRVVSSSIALAWVATGQRGARVEAELDVHGSRGAHGVVPRMAQLPSEVQQ